MKHRSSRFFLNIGFGVGPLQIPAVSEKGEIKIRCFSTGVPTFPFVVLNITFLAHEMGAQMGTAIFSQWLTSPNKKGDWLPGPFGPFPDRFKGYASSLRSFGAGFP